MLRNVPLGLRLALDTLFAAIISSLLVAHAFAQQPVVPYTIGNPALPVTGANPLPVVASPSGGSTSGITPVVSASAETSHVLKATPGNVYAAYATNLTGVAGWFMLLNATSAPVDGAVTPLDCVPLPATSTASISYGQGPPGVYSTGVVGVVSSAATCFTKTTSGGLTAFIHGSVK